MVLDLARNNNPVYNTVQCGHEPAHDNAINIGGRPVKDEKVCPGRVDQGSGGCQIKGPRWDLSVFDDGDPPSHVIPGTIEAEDYSLQSGTRTLDSSDSGGGLVVGYIENGDYLEFDVDITEDATYRFVFRIASVTGGSSVVVSANGSAVRSVDVPNTGGWRTWQTVSTQLNLTTSQDRLRLTFSGGGGYLVDVNRLDVSTVNDPVDPPELSVTDLSIDESAGAAAVVISLSRASTSEVSALAFTRADGLARGGEDFYGLTRAISGQGRCASMEFSRKSRHGFKSIAPWSDICGGTRQYWCIRAVNDVGYGCRTRQCTQRWQI